MLWFFTNWYSFYVNCGGGEVTIFNKKFEANVQTGGSVQFVHSKENWGTSSTGHFPWFKNHYKAYNVSVLKMKDSELYADARLSPLSLTYYGCCLANGNYTVTLHFAEIIFRDNNSFQSLGRQMFDIYIQDELKLKDFDIKKDAKGVDNAVKKQFNATVKNKTLDIRFYYSGKGLIAIPFGRVYDPLISAISVESELRGLDLRTGFFTFRQIKAATNNFDAANKIGEGGFGSVYKGILLDGSVIAVKNRTRGKAIKNGLANQTICIGIARGLAFLHEESTLKIVHRDIKPNNILLDKDLNPRISDFGLAKLDEDDNSHISTRVAGTIGYMAPEYAMWGYLTYKADVYSFGVVALEIISGKSNMKYRPSESFICLLDWVSCNGLSSRATILQNEGRLMELMDPRLGSNFNMDKA
ncbi:leucine-rich repeat receptor-like serine threonine- kinase [Olea europaea subsp. europaea]|uniref:non-specific serine/threonine protein kinase n=1 Tax=Olea europaea subsp. europaea TaxID=158383 RepID=A0A8S0QE60_OLEEU|nr:leucine-rich repeat receptor-like serine threonine- kinase [Olea europaea subsp. europaea]